MNLLLLSNSRKFNTPFLGHASEALNEWASDSGKILFIPYAIVDQDDYFDLVNDAFVKLIDKPVTSAATLDDPEKQLNDFSHVFIGGGNSFRLLKALYSTGLHGAIKARVKTNSISYMGSSAGTNMACPTMRTTNDMPIVVPPSLDALDIIPFQINPHYLDPEPDTTFQGETREERLTEFLEENDVPVVGLREGAWVHGTYGDHLQLGGVTGARLFSNNEVREVSTGESLNFLLNEQYSFDTRI